jgi:hypothetical protein
MSRPLKPDIITAAKIVGVVVLLLVGSLIISPTILGWVIFLGLLGIFIAIAIFILGMVINLVRDR